MDFAYSPRSLALQEQLRAFMATHIVPAEARFHAEIEANTAAGKRWTPLQLIEELKLKARAEGLWNLFLPDSAAAQSDRPLRSDAPGPAGAVSGASRANMHGAGLSNQDYAPLAEIMGRTPWASEVFNCSAPDTGNMEVLVRYGTPEHHARWLEPLLDGRIRSAFAMTEPAVASSDATNIESRIVRDGDSYVLNGRKWWTSGAGDPRCAVYIFMGKTDPDAPRHSQQSMIQIGRASCRERVCT